MPVLVSLILSHRIQTYVLTFGNPSEARLSSSSPSSLPPPRRLHPRAICFFSQEENLDLVRKGCENLVVHIANALKYGVKVTEGGN